MFPILSFIAIVEVVGRFLHGFILSSFQKVKKKNSDFLLPSYII